MSIVRLSVFAMRWSILILLSILLLMPFQCVAMASEMPETQFQTINDLLQSNEIQLQNWYWFSHPKLTSDIKAQRLFNKDLPLLGMEKAFVIGSSTYGENSPIKQYWDGVMFDAVKDTAEIVPIRNIRLRKRIYDLDVTAQKELLQTIRNSVDLSAYKPGTYYFKKDNGSRLVEILSDDLPFLRSYYSFTLGGSGSGADGKDTIFLVKTVIPEYSIFDYYPSGNIQRVVILNAYWDDDAILKNVYVNVHPYDDRPQIRMLWMGKSTHQPGETKTKITDPKSPYWIDNILHD